MAILSIEYFRARSIVDPETGCWVWQLGKARKGYGASLGFDGRTARAHRICYQVANNVRLPRNIFVCHKCDNPPCVNPAHLFAGTHSENMRDCVAKGRWNKPGSPRKKLARGSGAIGERNGMAKLTEAQVKEIRACGMPKKVIARTYKIDPKTVRQILSREIWAHVK